jgi:hypothetical protein
MSRGNRLVDSYLKAGETAAIALLALATLVVVVSIATAAIAGVLGDSAPAIEALLLSTVKEAASFVITGPVLGILARGILAYIAGLVLLVVATSTVARLAVDED